MITSIPSDKMLQYTYHKIQNMRKELSKLKKAPENIEKIRKALKTGSLPKDLRDLINKHLTAEMQTFNTPSKNTKWTTDWAGFIEYIEDTGDLINAHNNKQYQPRKNRHEECPGSFFVQTGHSLHAII